MHKPLVFMALLYGLGIILARYLDLPFNYLYLFTAAALIGAAIAYFTEQKSGRWVVLLLFVLLGMMVTGFTVERTSTPLVTWENQDVLLKGMVDRDADIRSDRVIYTLDVREVRHGEEIIHPGGRVLVSHYAPDAVYGYGDLLEMRGMLRRPLPPGNPGGFDYQTYLERQGILLYLPVRGEGAVVKVGLDRSNAIVYWTLTLKERLSAGLDRVLEPAAAALVRGITMGIRGGIDAETREVFVSTGVVHILSVSGLHVGFLLGLTLFLARLFRLRPVWTLVLVFGILAFYLVMVGFKPSVLRASIMAMLLMVAHQTGRLRDWPSALAAAALVILLGNPLALFDPGFQLSFTATWGILFLGPLLVKGMDDLAARLRLPWKTPVSWLLAIPLAAQLGTLPLVAYYYNLVSPIALPANIVTVPLVGSIFMLGLITAVLGAFAPVIAWLTGAATGMLVVLFLALVRFFAGLPGAFTFVPTPSPLLIGAWYLFLYSLGFLADPVFWRERFSVIYSLGPSTRRVFGPVMVGGIVLLAFLTWPIGQAGPEGLEVHFLDAGQGDCAVIRTGAGSTILIDAGGWRGELDGRSGFGKKVLLPYLRQQGVRRINLLVITHPDADHSGGAAALVGKLEVQRLIVAPSGEREEPPPGYSALMKEFAKAGTLIDEVWAGDRILVDRQVVFRVLGPPYPLLDGTRSDSNNNSVVLRLDYGERSFLFTGDIEQKAQALLLLNYDLQVDVLKVPHHGSGVFVPEFFKTVRPEAAVISVGRENRYGHPHPRTLEVLRRVGAEIYRTDLDGAVIVRTNGHQLEIETGRKRGALDPAA